MDPFARAAELITEQTDPGAEFRNAWRAKARAEQIPPDGDWRTWYVRGGRGGGKTWAAAHTLAEWILADPEPGEWGIVAPTYQLAWSVCVEGESGLLAALGTTVREVRDKQSKLVEHWHRSFAQVKLRNGHVVWVASAQDGGVGIQGKNLRAAWCVAAGEPVITQSGAIPVEDVRPGMRVWTRQGWKRVTAQGCTGISRPVVRVSTDGGASLRCTPDHRIWVERRGWVEARALARGDILSAWISPTALPPGSNGRAFAGTAARAAVATMPTGPAPSCMSPSGSALTGAPCQTGMSCITPTTTSRITFPGICNCSRVLSTSATTPARNRAGLPCCPLPSGPVWPSTPGLSASRVSAPALSAEARSCPRASAPCTVPASARWQPSRPTTPSAGMLRCHPGCVQAAEPLSFPAIAAPSTAAASALSGQLTLPRWRATASASVIPSARHAARLSPPRMGASGTAPASAAAGTTVLSVEPDGRADVYDLSIEDAHEFFAGGILVHNCDEIGMWDQWELTWNESLMYAVRKGTSRIIATGTPKKARRARKLVKLLLDDPAVPVSALRTLDNAANLSPAFLAEVVGKAKGTRLERQELEGILLADVEGALWTPEIIDAYRAPAPAELLRVVVAVDPAVSNEEGSDETGIVVVGEAEGGHGFVLGDYSMRGTPDECMRKAVWAYQFHQADRIVAEANNGGDYIGTLLHTVDPMVPFRKVVATRGKRVRAEPVSALYEQGRIHHAAVFGDLEEQMVSWVPSDPGDSPDRVDALVWACAELSGLSAGSWLAAYGTKRCEECEGVYAEAQAACPKCHPDEARKPAKTPEAAPQPQPLSGWAAAYGVTKCAQGHSYVSRRHSGCPHCKPGASRPGSGFQMPRFGGLGRR